MSGEHLRSAWVLLTTGGRASELAAAVASVRAGSSAEIVVVSNGAGPLDELGRRGVRVVELDHNVGVPGGRHVGVEAVCDVDVVFFLDDDAVVASPGLEGRVLHDFAGAPTLGAVSFRIVDPEGRSARRHTPRPGRLGQERSGPVAHFLGGACAIRRTAYEAAGGYWAELRYGHEELDLAWRMLDVGYHCRFDADAVVEHPPTPIRRHAEGWFLTGRNRVLVARRDLPMPLWPIHVATWSVVGLWRSGRQGSGRRYLAGLVEGLRRRPVPRRPIAWRTVWRLVRLGRPPIV